MLFNDILEVEKFFLIFNIYIFYFCCFIICVYGENENICYIWYLNLKIIIYDLVILGLYI